MQIAFKFEIGDVVVHKLNIGERRAAKMLVVERHMLECSGGVQKIYNVRQPYSGGLHDSVDPSKYYSFNEIELAEYEPIEPPKP